MLHNLLSRPLSFLGWTILQCSSSWTSIKHNQTSTNDSSTSPKEPMLHLSLSPCTGYQLQLASSSRHWCLHIEQSQAQHPPTSTHYYELTSPPEVWDLLVSDASWYHHREAQNHSPEHSRSPFLTDGMISPPHLECWIPVNLLSNNWKLISFNTTWLHPKLEKNVLLSFSPSLASLYLFEQCLRLGVTSTSSVCLPLQDESLYVFPNCKSLWIKVSAKWLNVIKRGPNVETKKQMVKCFQQKMMFLKHWHNYWEWVTES